jgi:hypothetical protein
MAKIGCAQSFVEYCQWQVTTIEAWCSQATNVVSDTGKLTILT